MDAETAPEVRMSRHRLTLIGLLGASLLAAGALAGCASGAASAPSATSSTPDAEASAPGADVAAAWVDAGRAIAVVTYGSSSCVPVVEGESTVANGVLTVTLADAQRDACTRDMAPRATLVPLPAGVDAAQPLAVTVSGAVEGKTRLDGLASVPAAPADLTASAGWVDRSMVAIVTYGSSGCVPTVESVTSQGETVEVQFATPPADQICTMDFAPRVTLADIGREAGQGDVSLVLSGGGVQVTDPVPVLGTR